MSVDIYHIQFSATANHNIRDVMQWFVDQGAKDAGVKWVQKIQEHILTLKTLPERCPIALEARDTSAKLRQLLFGKKHEQYRILFTIENKTVHVLHIRHVARKHI